MINSAVRAIVKAKLMLYWMPRAGYDSKRQRGAYPGRYKDFTLVSLEAIGGPETGTLNRMLVKALYRDALRIARWAVAAGQHNVLRRRHRTRRRPIFTARPALKSRLNSPIW
jgi:hypothetical protein